jgi:hypothetical protein
MTHLNIEEPDLPISVCSQKLLTAIERELHIFYEVEVIFVALVLEYLGTGLF